MICSMTAYAQAWLKEPPFEVQVEIRSFNSRYLDTVFHLPRQYSDWEKKLQKVVAEVISRGRVEIRVHIDQENNRAPAFTINEPLARAYFQALTHLKDQLGLKGSVTLDQVLALKDIIQTPDIDQATEDDFKTVETCLSLALNDLADMRRKEGALLAVDIDERLTFIEKGVAQIEEKSDHLLPIYHQRLMERLRLLTEDQAGIDPDRVAREAALLADRSDISEELVRANSHLIHFRSLMAGDEAAGRKLNFLLQELHREFNTMGVKADQAEIAHVVVDIKAEIEKIREQVQNVE